MNYSTSNTMDSPVRVVLSELLPVFDLAPVDICSFLCTCKIALTCEFPRPQFVPIPPPYMGGIMTDSVLPPRQSIFLITNGAPIKLANYYFYTAILSRQQFSYFRFKYVDCSIKKWHDFQDRIFKLLVESGLAAEISPGDIAKVSNPVMIGDKFYSFQRGAMAHFGGKDKKLLKYLVKLMVVTRGVS